MGSMITLTSSRRRTRSVLVTEPVHEVVAGRRGSTALERRPGFLRYETGVVVHERDVPRVSRDGEAAQTRH